MATSRPSTRARDLQPPLPMSSTESRDHWMRAAGIGLGIVVAAGLLRPSANGKRRKRLEIYLTDHRAGAAAALVLLDHLCREYPDGELGTFFRELQTEIRDDVETLERVMAGLRFSRRAAKRVSGGLVGALVRTGLNSGRPRGLRLFEALETLAIAVQGKRALARALAVSRIAEELPDAPNFTAFERRSVDQWERIERHRLAVARSTFARPARPAPEPKERPWTSTLASAIAKAPKTNSRSETSTLPWTRRRRRPPTPPAASAKSPWTT